MVNLISTWKETILMGENNKIIFLDIDGVLNIMSETYRSHYHGTHVIERHLMVRLEQLVKRTGAKIVISSSWELRSVHHVLKRMRFKYLKNIIGATPRNKDLRGDQIKDWIVQNDYVGTYVVLEDEIDDVCGDKCKTIPKRLVIEVDIHEGISNKNTLDAIEILNVSRQWLFQRMLRGGPPESEYRNHWPPKDKKEKTNEDI